MPVPARVPGGGFGLRETHLVRIASPVAGLVQLLEPYGNEGVEVNRVGQAGFRELWNERESTGLQQVLAEEGILVGRIPVRESGEQSFLLVVVVPVRRDGKCLEVLAGIGHVGQRREVEEVPEGKVLEGPSRERLTRCVVGSALESRGECRTVQYRPRSTPCCVRSDQTALEDLRREPGLRGHCVGPDLRRATRTPVAVNARLRCRRRSGIVRVEAGEIVINPFRDAHVDHVDAAVAATGVRSRRRIYILVEVWIEGSEILGRRGESQFIARVFGVVEVAVRCAVLLRWGGTMEVMRCGGRLRWLWCSRGLAKRPATSK